MEKKISIESRMVFLTDGLDSGPAWLLSEMS